MADATLAIVFVMHEDDTYQVFTPTPVLMRVIDHGYCEGCDEINGCQPKIHDFMTEELDPVALNDPANLGG